MSEQRHLDLAHEALIRGWKRLANWLSEDRDGQRIRQRFTTAATEWKARGEREEDLYSAGRIAEVDEWFESSPSKPEQLLSESEREFLSCSKRKLQQQRDAARSRELAGQAMAKIEEDPSSA